MSSYRQIAFDPRVSFWWQDPLKMWPRKITKTLFRSYETISVTNTWGLITEQRPKSVPKNGRKLVVLVASLSEPNLKDHIDQNWNMIIFLLYFSLGHDDGRVPGVLHCKVPNQQEYRIYIERVQERYIGILKE